MALTAGVPLGAVGPRGPGVAAQGALHVGEWVAVRRQQLPQQSDVRDGQAQRVDLGQPLLVWERGHVHAQLVERRVDAAESQAIRQPILVPSPLPQRDK